MMGRVFILILVWSCMISSAIAEEIKRVAVLEFRGVAVDTEMLLKLSDQARLAAVERLPKETYSIMTRENMMMVLEDMGKDASCMEGSCEVDIGRNIGADYVITGSIMKVEEQYLLTLKLHETASGKLLAGKELRKEKVLDLVDGTYEQSLFLLADGFGIDVDIREPSNGKTLYWVGTGLLVASGASAGFAYKSRDDFLLRLTL